MRVLIAGCGRLGQAVGLELAAAGHEVFGLRRNPSALPEAIAPVAADLLAPPDEWAERLPERLDRVYYIVTPADFTDESYRLAFVAGLANLRDALLTQGQQPQRLLFASSTAVYGQQADEWIDETSPTVPERFSGARLLEAEGLLQAMPWPTVTVRLGGIYGPGRDLFIRKVRAGEACRDAGFSNRIHADDAAGLLAHLGLLEEMESFVDPGCGQLAVFLGVDDEPTTGCAVMDFIAAQLGLPQPPRAPAGEEESGRRAMGVGSKRGRNAKLKRAGYALRYPTFREGYRALLSADGEGAGSRR
ncbi:NAD(P)-dependent oxidoreductase [Halorhodospira abdelmalekii]|nr:NAD-dependent epimerase/dehydratase family protein [Halorhodospira abdelmalekii]MBK1735056.1 NAD(P)-dependent oxidoreductase [Halorhodospira abdelmalekii]